MGFFINNIFRNIYYTNECSLEYIKKLNKFYFSLAFFRRGIIICIVGTIILTYLGDEKMVTGTVTQTGRKVTPAEFKKIKEATEHYVIRMHLASIRAGEETSINRIRRGVIELITKGLLLPVYDVGTGKWEIAMPAEVFSNSQ